MRRTAFRAEAFQALSDFLMGKQIATVGRRQTFLHLGDKPFLVVHQALYRFSRQRFGIAALLRCKLSQSGFETGGKIYFHAFPE